MVDFDVRLIEEVKPTIPTFALLSGEQLAQRAPPGQGMLLLQAPRPVEHVAVIRTRRTLDQDMAPNGYGGMFGQLDALSRRKAPVVLVARAPVPPDPPGG